MPTAISRAARIPAWQLALAAGLAVCAVYPFLPRAGQNPVYFTVGALAAGAAFASCRRTRPQQLGWLLLGAGVATWTLGDVLFTWVLDERFPSLADALYLASYPLLVAGIALLVRESKQPAAGALLDAAIVTVPVVLGLWVAFIEPLASDAGEPLLSRIVSSAYPLGDGVLLALLLALVLRPIPRRTSYWLLVTGVLALIGSDLAFDQMLTRQDYVSGSWVDCGWLLMYACFAAAALHPEQPLEQDGRAVDALTSRRLLLLGTASVAASALVLVSWAQGRIGLPVVSVAAALVPLLILGRLAMLVQEQRRASAHALNLAALVEGTDDAVIATDLDARITDWNPAAERIFGWSAAEAQGRPIWEVFAPGTEERSRAMLELVVRGVPIERFETKRTRKDGSDLDVSITLSPVRTAGGRVTGVSGILRDVTDQRRLEDRLRGAERMEAVGRLAGGIAHDFNNMLTAVLGHSQLLAASFEDDDERRKHAERIGYAADRAVELTRQLLAFSRRQVLRETTLDLNAIVAGACSGPQYAVSLAGDLGAITADRVELERVLANLVANAREATPAGGAVSVSTRNVELDDAFVALNAGAQAGSYVELAVADTGAGMDAETLGRVFEPFFTTKPEGDQAAAGLGLSTVYGIVKQSNGYVSAESTPGAGSVFRVFLPRIESLAAAELAAQPAEPAGAATILLVDDELVVRELVSDMLAHVGFEVQATGNPEHALAIVSEGRPLDLVITDLVMPGMNGRRLAERIEQIRPGLPVLFTSGYAGSESLKAGTLGARRSFLPKPFTGEELAHAAGTLLAACAHPHGAPQTAAAPAAC